MAKKEPQVSSIISAASSSGDRPLLEKPSDPSYIYPPSSFPELAVFDIEIQCPALVIPARRTATLRNQLGHLLLFRPKLKAVYPHETDKQRRKLLLADRTTEELQSDPLVSKLLSEEDCELSTHTIRLSYSDWTVEEVLRKLLPLDELPSAFEAVGTIAHLNLKEEQLPFQYIIGRVLLDKNAPRIQTVVTKCGTIETEYRTFDMKVIAGNDKEGWSRVTVKEEGCIFELDFTQVYWNSRLGGEHRRLVRQIQKDTRPGLVVADLMAGIGPFAVPLSANPKSEITVHANDLNPASFQYLEINCKRNKCQRLHCYNMDARAFCHYLQEQDIDVHHVIMNLPATAPEFLDAFRGYSRTILPTIHVHCFGPKEGAYEDEAIERCSKALGCPLLPNRDQVIVHIVRDVSPKKNMLCVSFVLPEEIRSLERLALDGEPKSKRAKLET